MNTRKLIITWKPDVLSMVKHHGSFDKEVWKATRRLEDKKYKGFTSRSERESFNNIKTLAKARRIVARRNLNEILTVTYAGKTIF